MAIINAMEKIVDLKMEELLKNSNCCKCEQCLENIKCIALNNLPAKYVSTTKGELFSRLGQIMIKQNTVDIDVAVMNAINIVKEHPRHSKP